MIHSVYLNKNNVCVGFHTGKKAPEGNIEVDSINEDYMWRKYENGEWSEKKYVPDHAQIELDRMEELEESQSDQDDLIMSLLLGGE